VTLQLVVPDNVAEVSFSPLADPEAGPVYLGLLPDGPLIVLHGSARAIWAAAPGAEASLVDRVAALAGVEAAAIAADVDRFVGDLLTQGFLDRRRG
jgi:Coenzyme PQQ synthesis protein D (PqqD)